MITIKDKKNDPYKVTTVSKAVKDVDTNKRIVTGLFNSYYHIDSDMDMLLPNAASKSILERGVGSKKGNKIKHLKDHNWDKVVARLDVLDERDVDFDMRKLSGIYHESYYPDTQDSNDLLIKISEGLYDDRSIGFQYVNIVLAERESKNDDNVNNWNTYYPLAINKEVADKAGYFYIVKEIKLFEGSDVAFGANSLTPMLGMKDANDTSILDELFSKLDIMKSLFKSGKLTDEGFHQLEMEQNQIKSIISQIVKSKPSIKDTLMQGREEGDTKSNIDNLRNLLLNY